MLEGFDLSGRVALVTGGGTGIGRAIALLLAERGADVALAGRRADKLENVAAEIGKLGRNSLCVTADVRNADAVQAMIGTVVDHFGRLDIVINNAGGNHAHVGLAKMSTEGWDRDVSLNLSAAHYCSQAAFPHLRASKGTIVHISSVAGVKGTNGVGAYSAAKAGLQMLTRVQASEWGPHGIRVNCVAPGMTATEKAHAGWAKSGFDAAAVARSAFALGRYGECREVAQMVVFFASDAASYISGETVSVSGGPVLGGMVEVD